MQYWNAFFSFSSRSGDKVVLRGVEGVGDSEGDEEGEGVESAVFESEGGGFGWFCDLIYAVGSG